MKRNRSGWAVVYSHNGNKQPIVVIDSVFKTKKKAEEKLKWLNPKNDKYRIIPAPLINLVKEEKDE